MHKTIAIDFDGVIHSYTKGWQGGGFYDTPLPGVFHAIKKLQEKGYNIVIFTARDESQYQEILEYCIEWAERWDVEFGGVFVTNQKPRAVAYIDDRAIRFTNWKDMLNYF